MSSAPQKPEYTLGVPERRFHSRRRVQSLAYVNVGASRGVVSDISEGGLGIRAAASEIEAHISTVAFHLPGSQGWVEIRGQIAWLSESGREAGVRFLDPPETIRSRVQEWTSLINPAEAGLHVYVRESAAATVYELNPLDDPRWETFVRNHPRASVFHSTNWLRALQIAYGYDPTVVTTCPRGVALTNGLVSCRVESWLTGRRMVSLPFSDHCEPLVNNSAELDDLLFNMRHEVDTGRCKYIEIRPLFYQPGSLTGFGEALTYCFHRLDLNRSKQELLSSFHKNCVQRKIRRAEREKLHYEEGTSEGLLQSFYELLVMTRRRQFLPPPPQYWFRALIASFGEDLKIRVVSKDDLPVASILTISHKKTMTYKYGCSDARSHRLGGMALLLWNSIQEAKDRDLDELDMGRSDCNKSGLIEFKERWGAVGTHLNYWRYPPSRHVGTNAWQKSILRHLVPATPSSVLRTMGRLLYRHIG